MPSNENKPFWQRMDLLGPAVQVILVAGGVAIFLSNSATKTDGTATALSELKTELRTSLDKLNARLETFPGFQERVAQLERRQLEQQGFNGAVDARLNSVEQKTAANTIEVQNIKSASGGRMR